MICGSFFYEVVTLKEHLNINDVLNRNKDKQTISVFSVPKKDVIVLLPYLGSQSQLFLKIC